MTLLSAPLASTQTLKPQKDPGPDDLECRGAKLAALKNVSLACI